MPEGLWVGLLSRLNRNSRRQFPDISRFPGDRSLI